MNKFTKKTLHGAHVQLDNPIEVMTKATVLCGNSSKEFSQGTLLDGNAVNEVANDIANSTVETKAVEIESDIKETLSKLLPAYQYVSHNFVNPGNQANITRIIIDRASVLGISNLYTVTLFFDTTNNSSEEIGLDVYYDEGSQFVTKSKETYVPSQHKGEHVTYTFDGSSIDPGKTVWIDVCQKSTEGGPYFGTLKVKNDSTRENIYMRDGNGNVHTDWTPSIAINNISYIMDLKNK